jgi:hypothetical protein
MKNETKYRLSYCRICKNRARNSEFEVICSLTKEFPTFKNNCENYDLDEITYKRKVEEVKDEIDDKYNRNTLLKKVLSSSTYKEYNYINDSKYINLNQTKELKFLNSTNKCNF